MALRPALTRHPRRLLSGGVALAALLLAGGYALAQEAPSFTSLDIVNGEPRPGTGPRELTAGGWNVQGLGTQTGYFDTNPLLQTTGARALWGSITTPELVVSNRTPTTTLYSDTLVNINQFNQSDYNSNDVHSAFSLNSQTQRWGAGFLTQIDYDTTRSSELSNFNFKVSPVRHFGALVAPQISYKPLPTDRFGLTASYQTSQYDGTIFTDYNVYGLTPSYSHQFDPANSGVVTVQAQRYRSTSGPSNTVDSIGPTIGWLGVLTPQLKANASVGVQTTRQKGATTANKSWQAQTIFAGGLTFKNQQDAANLTASRSQYPFGNGSEALLTTVSLGDTHDINRLFAVGAAASYQTADYASNSTGNLETLTAATAHLDYHATEQVDLVGSYQFRHETLVGSPNTADENMVTLSLTYHPKAWTL